MKKNVILFIAGILSISSSLFAQSSSRCATDVWMTLDNKQIPKAVKLADECVIQNPNSADAWLMRANAYLQRHQEEEKNLEKNPKYIVKEPDAIIIANDCFIKAQEINPNIEPRTGMFGPNRGRSLCALPLYNKATEILKVANYEKARDLLIASIRNFGIEKTSSTQLKYNMGIFYSTLSGVYLALKDSANAKQTIINGVKTNTTYHNIYLDLCDIYKAEKDTANFFKTIQAAKKNVPDSMALDIYIYELEYYALTKNVDKMNATRDLIFEKYGKTVQTIILVVAYLTENQQLESANELLLQGLEMDPLNFKLNSWMARRYYVEGLKYEDEYAQAIANKKYDLINSINAKKKEALEKAHEWAEKAYQINSDDMDNNIRLHSYKSILQKEIPEDLKRKVESYRSGNYENK